MNDFTVQVGQRIRKKLLIMSAFCKFIIFSKNGEPRNLFRMLLFLLMLQSLTKFDVPIKILLYKRVLIPITMKFVGMGDPIREGFVYV